MSRLKEQGGRIQNTGRMTDNRQTGTQRECLGENSGIQGASIKFKFIGNNKNKKILHCIKNVMISSVNS